MQAPSSKTIRPAPPSCADVFPIKLRGLNPSEESIREWLAQEEDEAISRAELHALSSAETVAHPSFSAETVAA